VRVDNSHEDAPHTFEEGQVYRIVAVSLTWLVFKKYPPRVSVSVRSTG